MSLKKNLFANYFGQGWRAIMSLVFIPVYIKYLGIEAYGLIGIFVLMQAWLSLLDMGIRTAFLREMARFTGGGVEAKYIRDLLRSVELISIVVAVLVGLGIWQASGWLAASWLQVDELSISSATKVFTLMGLIIAMRFIESIYTSSIDGLQFQVLQNVITSTMATIRSIGAIFILIWISPTIEAFFLWQAVVSAATVLTLVTAVYRVLPASSEPAHFSMAALSNIWNFAVGIMGITFLALLLTQTDKILLAKLLPLTAFGYYALAAVVAGGLIHLLSPIGTSFYPKFTELITQQDNSGLIKTYHLGAQLVTVLVGSSAMILMVLADRILLLWTHDPTLTANAAPIVILLSLGTFLNGLMWMPYNMQLAHGWTSLTLKINLIAVLVLIPAILWIVPIHGARGAAWIWVVLNAGYCLIGVHFMHRRILKNEKWDWYGRDILVPIFAAVSATYLLSWIMPTGLGAIGELSVILSGFICVLFISGCAAPLVRKNVIKITLDLTKSIGIKSFK